jgi:hypothetical protein
MDNSVFFISFAFASKAEITGEYVFKKSSIILIQPFPNPNLNLNLKNNCGDSSFKSYACDTCNDTKNKCVYK